MTIAVHYINVLFFFKTSQQKQYSPIKLNSIVKKKKTGFKLYDKRSSFNDIEQSFEAEYITFFSEKGLLIPIPG